MRWLRRASLIVVAIVVAVPILAAAAFLFVDVNHFRGAVSNAVENATGRRVTIAGDLSLTLGRPIALAVEDVTLANPPWASRPDMARLGRMELDLQVLPLIRGRLVIERVLIEDLDVYLETNADGTGNWRLGPASSPADLTSPLVPVPEDAAAPPTADAGDPRQPTVTSLIRNASAENIRLHWTENAQADAPVILDVASLDIEHETADVPVAFSLSTNATADVPAAEMSGELTIDGRDFRVEAIDLQTGATAVTGHIALTLGDPRPAVSAVLAATRVDLADLSGPAGDGEARHPPSASHASQSNRVIPDIALPFDRLNAVDVDVELDARIDTLARNGTPLAGGVTLSARLSGGQLSARAAADRLVDGRAEGTVERTADGAVVLTVTARQLAADRLLASFGSPSMINGGRFDADVSLTGTGGDVRRLLAGSDGTLQLVVRDATVTNRWLDRLGGDVLSQIAGALNPQRSRGDTAHIGCTVARGRIEKGQMTFLHGLALETDRVDASGSGTVNLRTEDLDIGIRAQANEGLGVGVATIASRFVRVRGSLARPAVQVDLLGTANDVARLGAGIVNDALRGNVPSLRDVFTDEPYPCRVALGEASPTTARQPPASSVDERLKRGIDDASKRLRGLFNR